MSGSAGRLKYDIHPDLRPLALIRPPLDKRTIPAIQKAMRLSYYRERPDREVRVERVSIPSEGGANIRALLYVPEEVKTESCLLYLHGGGYVFPAANYQYRLARLYAKEVGCRVLFPDYRLAPEHPFPAAPEDCFAAYLWLRGRVPGAPIAVCGDSAGGTLSMAVCLMAKDRGVPGPCAQMLTYPYVGHCGPTASMQVFTDAPLLSSRDIAAYDAWYVPDPGAGKREYRSPIEAQSFDIFPATYIETAEFDPLRDGGILCAMKLRESGVSVELNNTKGTVHGYDMMLRSAVVQEQAARRIRFLKKTMANEE